MAAQDEYLWRGTSSRERADERRSRLIDACTEIVGGQGTGALAVRPVCSLAGVSPRKFYESFPDTDALLLATYERAVKEMLAATSGVLDRPLPTSQRSAKVMRTRLLSVFDAATQHLEQHPNAGCVMFREALRDDGLRARAAAALPEFLHTIQRALFGGSASDRKRRFGRIESTMMAGGLAAVFAEWLSGTSNFTRHDVVVYCAEATFSILSLKLPE